MNHNDKKVICTITKARSDNQFDSYRVALIVTYVISGPLTGPSERHILFHLQIAQKATTAR